MAERGVRRVALVEEVVQAGREHGRLLLRTRRRSGADPAGVCLARASGCASMRRGDCCMRAVTPTLLPPGLRTAYSCTRARTRPVTPPPVDCAPGNAETP